MSEIVVVYNDVIEVIEVAQQGPQGPQGIQGIAGSVIIFNNVADMISGTLPTGGSITLVLNDICSTMGYTSVGDGGGNDYQIVAAATGTDDGGTYIDLSTHQAKGLFPGGLKIDRQYSLIGDGAANDTTAFSNFMAIGGGEFVGGTYLIDNITISNRVVINKNSKNKIKRTVANGHLINLDSSAIGSELSGFTIDGDENTFGASYVGIFAELKVQAIKCKVSDIEIHNAVDTGISAIDADDGVFRYISTDNCPNNEFVRSDGLTVQHLRSKNAKNNTVPVNVRGCIFSTISNSTITDIVTTGVGGDTAVLSPTNTVTGILALDLDNCIVSGLNVINMVDDIDHLAISILRAYSCKLSNLNAFNYAGIGIEIIDCDSSTLNGFLADSFYHETSFSSDSQNVGLIVHSTPFYPLGQRERKALVSNQNLIISNGISQRNGIGIQSRASSVIYNHVKATANRTHGFRVQKFDNNDSFSNKPSMLPNFNEFNSCHSSFNELGGFSIREGHDTIINGGRYHNNGNDTTASIQQRSGIVHEGSGLVSNLIVSNVVARDILPQTLINKITFKPGSSDITTFPNNNTHTYVVTLLEPDEFILGQKITIKNVDGASDISFIIMDMNQDEATLRCPSAITFSDTGNTIALSGTWTGSGEIITGSGGAALTEVNGPFWVTDGTEWIQVQKVADNNTLDLVSAFATPLSSTTLNKLATDVDTLSLQQAGIDLTSSNVIGAIISNVIASEQVLVETVIFDISDNAATSFTPQATAGLLIITDANDTGGSVQYNSGGSPTTGIAGGTAKLAVTTGVLTGTTGSDVFLTVSAHTDGKIYIENRLGSTRTVSIQVQQILP